MNASAINLPAISAGLSRILAQSLPDSCTIQRATMSAGGGDTWTDVGAAVACRLAQISRVPQERNQPASERIVADARWNFALPARQDVAIGDRILFGTRTFKVVEVRGTSFEVQRYALATEMVKA